MDLLTVRLLQLAAVAIVGLFVTGCANTPALHVIGVHEGQAPPGVDDRPWWAKCRDDKESKDPGAVRTPPSIQASIECHQKYTRNQQEGEILVSVSDESRPIVLALTAYERTHWRVSLTEGARLKKVILAGYHSQRVSGIPAETPIETYTHDPSPCERCWQGAKFFYSYESPPWRLREITDLEITSFQGRYKGSEFSIFPGMKRSE